MGPRAMSQPPVPSDADLRDFRYFPLYRARLFASTLYAQASHEELGVALILWLKSWDQIPAGSLPDDDRQLCHLAELGRDLRKWREVKDMALHGWKLCDDGRLYHSTIAEMVNGALERKNARRARTAAATKARRNVQRNDDRYDVRNDDRNVNVTTTVTLEEEEEVGKRTITKKGNRPGREPNGSLLPPLPPLTGGDRARARERGTKSKSPREVQTEAFYHAALELQRERNRDC